MTPLGPKGVMCATTPFNKKFDFHGIDRTYIEESAGFASADPKFAKSRHRIIRSNTETIGAAFGRAYRGASRPCKWFRC